MMSRIGAVIALVVAGLTRAIATGWGALVLFYLAPGPGWVRSALAWSFVALGLVARERTPSLLANALTNATLWLVLSARRGQPGDGAGLPDFIAREFRAFLTCGVLAHGVARVHCGMGPPKGNVRMRVSRAAAAGAPAA